MAKTIASLAEVLLQNIGDTSQSQQVLGQILSEDPSCAAAYPLLAEVYERRNETIRARRIRTVSALLGYSPPENDRCAVAGTGAR